jgi:hypothetical protein
LLPVADIQRILNEDKKIRIRIRIKGILKGCPCLGMGFKWDGQGWLSNFSKASQKVDENREGIK